MRVEKKSSRLGWKIYVFENFHMLYILDSAELIFYLQDLLVL